MASRPMFVALAEAFHAEGTDIAFVLTGNGNMHWDAAFSALSGTRSVHVRHEHCACSMAIAYAAVTGKVGVASVTCGPGLSQIMTALASAARSRIPLVVFAGEGPIDAPWYHQNVDQPSLVKGTGAEYIAAHSPRQVMHHVMRAFFIARTERRPVVVGVPLDMQMQNGDFAYRPSALFIPEAGPRVPNPDYVRRAVARIAAARRIVILAGRGALAAGARAACEKLADLCDAALATTLPARGLFAGHPRHIGVSGGYAHEAAREAFEASDLVISVGSSLTPFTSDKHNLFRPQDVLMIDADPVGGAYGDIPPPDLLCGDALLCLEALAAELEARPRGADWDVAEYSRRVHTEPADSTTYEVGSDLLDPRAVVAALDRTLPRHWQYVTGAGHYLYFVTHLYNRDAANFLSLPEYGAIGNGLSYAIGMAFARPDVPVVLLEGDGGLMMHVQELETIRRYGLKILICVLNDGAFGAEIHRLRAEGLNDAGTIYGRDQLAAVARGFGLRGATVRSLEPIPELLEEYKAGADTMLWDIQISDRVLSPTMRRATGAG